MHLIREKPGKKQIALASNSKAATSVIYTFTPPCKLSLIHHFWEINAAGSIDMII